MKMIKKYLEFIKESVETDNLVSFYNELEKKYPNYEFHSFVCDESNGLSFVIESCPIEPEVGSYVSRTEINITIKQEADKYSLDLRLISGQYGSEEEEEDSDYEVEMDYQVGSSDLDIDENGLTLDVIENKIEDAIEDYCM